jgi:RNA polymerase sigma factor for flagellar operon FliA
VDYERLVVENLPLVDSVVRFIARRHRLSADEADELGATVRLKLVDNDYAVVRRFQGRSSLRTYLTTVIQRHFLDWRTAMWGKWRPSAQARRLGPAAVLLDQLLTRDGLSFEAASDVVRTRHAEIPDKDLREIFRQLPTRMPRRFVEEDHLELLQAAGGDEQDTLLSLDRDRVGDRIEEALKAALGQLTPQEQLILRLRFCDKLPAARIAELVGVETKPLYRQMEGIMRTLRSHLEARGVTQSDIADIVGDPAQPLGQLLESGLAANVRRGPSIP